MSIVSVDKKTYERSQRFHFNSTEVKHRSERSLTFDFNSTEVKQRSECNQ